MQKVPSSYRLEYLCKTIEDEVIRAQSFEKKNKENLCYPEYAGFLQSALNWILNAAHAVREDSKRNKANFF